MGLSATGSCQKAVVRGERARLPWTVPGVRFLPVSDATRVLDLHFCRGEGENLQKTHADTQIGGTAISESRGPGAFSTATRGQPATGTCTASIRASRRRCWPLMCTYAARRQAFLQVLGNGGIETGEPGSLIVAVCRSVRRRGCKFGQLGRVLGPLTTVRLALRLQYRVHKTPATTSRFPKTAARRRGLARKCTPRGRFRLRAVGAARWTPWVWGNPPGPLPRPWVPVFVRWCCALSPRGTLNWYCP
jgi:hypothetical protein